MNLSYSKLAFICCLLLPFVFGVIVTADEPIADPAFQLNLPSPDDANKNSNTTNEQINKTVDAMKEKTGEIAEQVNQIEEAKKYSAGILEPIYSLAEYMSFSSFYWVAFAIMVSGVVSFALQLVLAKLFVLLRGGLSLTQIFVDVQGLVISIVGLFLTTQAATENSNFTTNPAAVLSATAVGVVVGFMFYLWGQSQELEALKGRKEEAKIAKKIATRM